MRLPTFGITLFVLFAACLGIACQTGKRVNVMDLPAECDSVPPRFVGNGPRGFLMPRLTSISQSLGVIAGSVIDSVSQTRISSATITLFELAQSGRENQIGRAIPTDMSGGFSFDSVVAGAYVVKARRIGFEPREQRANAIAGQVDTVNFPLPASVICHGY